MVSGRSSGRAAWSPRRVARSSGTSAGVANQPGVRHPKDAGADSALIPALTRRIQRSWLVPSLVWLAFLGAVVGKAGSLDRWTKPRWDGVHYVSIAEHGYEIHRCGSPPIWCGNPWFPGWSYVNAAIWRGLGLRALGVPIPAVFIAVAVFALLALLVLIFKHARVLLRDPEGWTDQGPRIGTWACLGLVCQPASFYYLTQFPYTFVLLTAFLFLLLTRAPAVLRCTPRWGTGLAAGLGFWSGLSYPSAFFFTIYPLVELISERGYRDFRRLRRLAGWGVVFFSGTLCVCLVFYFKFGMFWLYFVHQAQYHREAPIVNTFLIVMDLLRDGNENERLTFLWYAFGLTVVCLRVRKIHLEPSLWFVLFVLLFYPATGSWIGVYRYYLVGIPLFVLLGAADCSRWLKGAYLLLGLLLQLELLYPRYLDGNLM
jgi:hypothetical protein